ncbi:MAG: RNA polymerase factor sigma-54 [Phycisphaerae bacterium]
MSRYFAMIPSQQMRMEQRLTPQLIQSMEILQLPLPALEARIREELSSNPVLEEAEAEAAPAADGAPAGDATRHEPPTTTEQEAKSFERLERLGRDYGLDSGDSPYAPARDRGERDAKLDAMAKTPTRGVSLQEYLESQWAMIEASAEAKRAGMALIGWMDNDGYLRTEHERTSAAEANGVLPLVFQRTPAESQALLEEIAASAEPALGTPVLEEALDLVQTLEPSGVGARDLTECLLIQLDGLPAVPPLTDELVRKHLIDIGKNRLPAVARATGKDIEEVKEALAVLSKLHHHPGLLISSSEVPTVTPDIIVEYAEDGDGLLVRLARGNNPRLRVSGQYQRMLEQCREDKDAREFLRKHFESATTLIDAIQFRRERLLQLAKVVVERQREFFEFGGQSLKVLKMRDLAEEFSCDPSTISRTVDEKYIQSPRGIYPLRMFFTSGTETQSGEEVSWDRIRTKVKEIIDAEDKRNPLADDQIAKEMSTVGLPISRRTVAKYRAQLNIPSARERQTF